MKYGSWTLVFVVTILFCFFVLGERLFSPSFNTCIATQAQNYGKSAGERLPVSIRKYVLCSGEFIDTVNGSITALATIVIAAFTFTLWRATTAQFELARDAFIADKRAFVFASGIQGLYESDPATGQFNWRVGPIWQNSGDTPTRDLQLYTDGLLSNVQMPSAFDFDSIDPNVPPGPGMLGPKMNCAGGQAPHFPRSALTPQDLLDIQNGKKFFYLWGWAKYRDTLPNTPPHITRYCFRIICTGDPLAFDPAVDPNGVKFFNLHEQRGNCADEGCNSQGLG